MALLDLKGKLDLKVHLVTMVLLVLLVLKVKKDMMAQLGPPERKATLARQGHRVLKGPPVRTDLKVPRVRTAPLDLKEKKEKKVTRELMDPLVRLVLLVQLVNMEALDIRVPLERPVP